MLSTMVLVDLTHVSTIQVVPSVSVTEVTHTSMEDVTVSFWLIYKIDNGALNIPCLIYTFTQIGIKLRSNFVWLSSLFIILKC